MIAADLLRALRAAEYRVELRDGRLAVAPPGGTIPPALRDRIAEHRNEIKDLLASADSGAACTPWDPLLLEEETCRRSVAHHRMLLTSYIDRYAITGYGPFLEIAAWFAAVLDMHQQLAENAA